jgi:hypothetical protein
MIRKRLSLLPIVAQRSELVVLSNLPPFAVVFVTAGLTPASCRRRQHGWFKPHPLLASSLMLVLTLTLILILILTFWF